MYNTIKVSLLLLFFLGACKTTKDTPSVKKPTQWSEKTLDEVIGQVAQNLTTGRPESLMSNWAVDLIHRQAEIAHGKKIDFTLLNSNTLRAKVIAKGDMTRRKIIALVGAESRIFLLQADGATIEKTFQTIAASGGCPLSHATFEIHPMPRAPTANNIHIGGEPLKSDKIYTFAVNDAMIDGDAELSKLKRKDLGPLSILLIEGIQKDKILDARIDSRIVVVNN